MANQLAVIKEAVVGQVQTRIEELTQKNQLGIPDNYSVGNALQSAWLILQQTKDINNRPVLTTCTKDSIANALFDTVVQGLNPQKKQCYYIPYGDQLTCMRSYFGTMAVAQRLPGVYRIVAQVIYEGDTFEYQIKDGRKEILEHKQSFANIDPQKIAGAYCTIFFSDGREPETDIMTKAQIERSWAKSKTHKVQQEFPEEMAKRTVINRACKYLVNASDDSSILMQSFADTGEQYMDAPEEPVAPEQPEDMLQQLNNTLIMAPCREIPEGKPAEPEPETQSENTEEALEGEQTTI